MTPSRPLPVGTPPPIVIVEGSDAAFDRAVEERREAGWLVRPGFDPPFGDRGVVRAGRVASAADAAQALLAVLGGAGVLVHGLAEGEVLDRLLGDLRHVGTVERRSDATGSSPTLDADARSILARIADGQTLGQAANALGLSRRTADRRLAEARRALGVERTVEAVAQARRLGWLG